MKKKLSAKRKQQAAEEEESKEESKKEEDEVEEEKKYDFSRCDFPMAYSDRELAKHWFEFNDTVVKPVMPGEL